MILKNYQLNSFEAITDEEADRYAMLIQHLLPANSLSGWEFKGLWSSPYSTYVAVKGAFRSRADGWQFQAIQAAFGLTPQQQMYCRVFDYYAALKFLEEDLLAILEKERMLPTRSDPDLKAAGIGRLDKYGDVLTIDSLARTYHTTWEEIGRWKYSKVYTILAMENEREQIMSKYYELKQPKQ
jgi:hypothetical protein